MQCCIYAIPVCQSAALKCAVLEKLSVTVLGLCRRPPVFAVMQAAGASVSLPVVLWFELCQNYKHGNLEQQRIRQSQEHLTGGKPGQY